MTSTSHPTERTDTTPLVVRFGAMGDMVLLTVLLRALAKRHGRPVDLLSSGAWTPALLAHDPHVRELRLLASRKRPYWLTPSQWSAAHWLRQHQGPVILCDADEASAKLLQRAGVPRERLLRAWDHRPPGEVHWADWWVQIAQRDPPGLPGPREPRGFMPAQAASAATLPDAQPVIHVPAAWRDEARPWMASLGLQGPALVLMQPGNKKTHRRGKLATAYSDKNWDAVHWGQVARGVAEQLASAPQGAVIGVCGSTAEASVAEDVLQAAGPLPAGVRIVNLAREQLSLPRLAVLAEQAHSMVSVDTGPAHLAAALDCPLVVLYGSAGWGNWKPRAPRAAVHCLGSREPDKQARVDSLRPEAVLEAWRQLPGRVSGNNSNDL
jgi:heptosyltransferase-2/heptosyltransferase-3